MVRVGVLYSGGKDSNLALYKASSHFKISCLINIQPKSSESEIFHYPTANIVNLQAEALEIPLVKVRTGDREEEQIKALYNALKIAKEYHGIEGVVTGAVRSVYQATRFQRVCDKLDLWCFNPLWLMDEEKVIEDALSSGFKVITTRLAVYPFNAKYLGESLDEEFREYLRKIRANVVGEGGEYETLVTYMPLFKKEIRVVDYEKILGKNEGEIIVRRAVLG
jgi:ABC transporter with metal-binding/Fe-S-binding domain ATP-binding protein